MNCRQMASHAILTMKCAAALRTPKRLLFSTLIQHMIPQWCSVFVDFRASRAHVGVSCKSRFFWTVKPKQFSIIGEGSIETKLSTVKIYSRNKFGRGCWDWIGVWRFYRIWCTNTVPFCSIPPADGASDCPVSCTLWRIADTRVWLKQTSKLSSTITRWRWKHTDTNK